jgi:acetyl esterase
MSTEACRAAIELDPDVRQFATAVKNAYARHATGGEAPVKRAREIAEIVRRPWAQGGPEMSATVDHRVPVVKSDIRIRVHTPPGVIEGPALVYLHGGGWTLFSLETHDRLMREYAGRGRLRVIGVDYSLSPEARFPRAIEECCEVMRWLQTEGKSLGVDTSRLVIGGDSAGANLAVATCLKLRDDGAVPLPRGMLLNYGAWDAAAANLPDGASTPPEFTLTCEEMKTFWRNYLRGPADVENPLANLLRADLRKLPSALMVIADCDTLYAENLAMAEKFRAAGVPVRSAVYPGTTHSFLESVSIAAVADWALQDSVTWLGTILGLNPDEARAG